MVGAAGVGDPYFPELGGGGYDVQRYEIDLEWLPDGGRIEATTTLHLVPSVPLDAFHLDLVGLDVEAVTVDGEPAAVSHEGRELVVDPRPVLPAGDRVAVAVTYAGIPQPVALGSEVFGAGWLVDGRDAYVVSEPAGAASWFPANDHPTDKATFRIEVTVPPDLQAVANGVRVSERTEVDGRRTAVFEVRDPMATYLASVVVGDLVVEERRAPNGLALRDAYPRRLAEQARRDLAVAGDVVVAFERWFGPFPFEVYGHVVVDEVLGYALENQTLSLFGADLVTGDGQHETVVAHELAHQWFGNAVSPSTWRDIWLNEGFATYAEWIWEQERGGRPVVDSARAVHAGADLGVPPGDPGTSELFQPTVYRRGALAVHALSVAMGDDAFRVLLREWPARFGGADASTADLLALAEELSGRDLDAVVQDWVYGVDLPPFPG
ncbi:MAG TPA: M1 family metallopeptidase [Acidimicrobiales bacterium]|nr:M1 family metallopeptidase [Acidimicrobiales bacterium]